MIMPDTNSLEDEFRGNEPSGDKLDNTDPETDFVDKIVAALDEADDAPSSKSVTANDPELWAALQALDADDDREMTFLNNIGLDPTASRSKILGRLVRAGIGELDSQLATEIKQASDRHDAEDDLWN